ncbi:MAG TPA: transglutaminase family protein, partial [Vicinamibacteria bacterium]
MRLRVEHTTVYAYDAPVAEGYTELRLRPREGSGQRCLSFSLHTDPAAQVHAYKDRYGNEVQHFDLLATLETLTVSARSEVETSSAFHDPERELALLDRFDFLAPTAKAPFTEGIRALAEPCRVPGDAFAAATRVLWTVRRHLRYESGTTDVTTNAAEALGRGVGVCQDFTHLMIAACRVVGVPARYVSGYIHAPGSASAAASHAWVDVFAERQGWLSLDPTHDRAQGEEHVRVAVGRDYDD